MQDKIMQSKSALQMIQQTWLSAAETIRALIEDREVTEQTSIDVLLQILEKDLTDAGK